VQFGALSFCECAELPLYSLRKPKRVRTAFSPAQLLHLERAFEQNRYVVGQERRQLAASLSLSETQVTALPARCTTPLFNCSTQYGA